MQAATRSRSPAGRLRRRRAEAGRAAARRGANFFAGGGRTEIEEARGEAERLAELRPLSEQRTAGNAAFNEFGIDRARRRRHRRRPMGGGPRPPVTRGALDRRGASSPAPQDFLGSAITSLEHSLSSRGARRSRAEWAETFRASPGPRWRGLRRRARRADLRHSTPRRRRPRGRRQPRGRRRAPVRDGRRASRRRRWLGGGRSSVRDARRRRCRHPARRGVCPPPRRRAERPAPAAAPLGEALAESASASRGTRCRSVGEDMASCSSAAGATTRAVDGARNCAEPAGRPFVVQRGVGGEGRRSPT